MQPHSERSSGSRHLAGGAVILAAGKSKRFGSDKRLFQLSDGRTMLETTLAVYREAFDTVFVVLQPADEARLPLPGGRLLPDDVQAVHAPDAALGMGHSLAAGIRAGRSLDFLFVALADMPDVRAETLQRLQEAMDGTASIVQPIYRGTPGHPVGFGSFYFRELELLTGDIGAKRVIAANRRQVARLDVDDPGVLTDFDVPP